VVYNAANTIETTIKSIINQNYINKRYIIVDGGSTDGTIEIIGKYREKIDYFISEKDNGIYDAMNKGIDAVNNSDAYVMFINADDYLIDNSILKYIAKNDGNADFIYGNVMLEENNIVGKKVMLEDLLYGSICHQAMLVKKKIFNSKGKFSLDYKLCSDYEFMVKCFMDDNITKRYLDKTLACMSLEGASSDYNLVYKERLRIIKQAFEIDEYIKAKLNVYFEKVVRFKKRYIKSSIFKGENR
jgi:Predicted glycosyltransferases